VFLYLATHSSQLLTASDHEGSTPVHYVCEQHITAEVLNTLLMTEATILPCLQAFQKRNRLSHKPYDLVTDAKLKQQIRSIVKKLTALATNGVDSAKDEKQGPAANDRRMTVQQNASNKKQANISPTNLSPKSTKIEGSKQRRQSHE
jgi:hypothetical protein